MSANPRTTDGSSETPNGAAASSGRTGSALGLFLKERGLALVHCPKKFRKIVAKSEDGIGRGTTVLSSEPLAAIATDMACCSYCFRFPNEEVRLQRCARCKRALYCKAECQLQDWTAGHKKLCKWMDSGDGDLWRDVEMLVKVTKALTDGDAVDSGGVAAKAINMEAFATLVGHRDAVDEGHRQAVLTATRSRDRKLGFSDAELSLFLHRFHCNNASITDTELFPVGEGTYPLGSLLNHSCNPNCAVVFRGRTQVIRAIRDIGAGEELTITYVDAMLEPDDRNIALMRKYRFSCVCDRCGGDGTRRAMDGRNADEIPPSGKISPDVVGESKTACRQWNLSLWSKHGYYCPCSVCRAPKTVSDVRVHLPNGVMLVDRFLHGIIWLKQDALADWLAPQLEISGLDALDSVHSALQDPARVLKETPNVRSNYIVEFTCNVVRNLRLQTHPKVSDRQYQILHAEFLQTTLLAEEGATAENLGGSRTIHNICTFSYLSKLFQAAKGAAPASAQGRSSAMLSLYILAMYLVCYERYHPLTTVHLVLTAKLCVNAFIAETDMPVQEHGAAAKQERDAKCRQVLQVLACMLDLANQYVGVTFPDSAYGGYRADIATMRNMVGTESMRFAYQNALGTR